MESSRFVGPEQPGIQQGLSALVAVKLWGFCFDSDARTGQSMPELVNVDV